MSAENVPVSATLPSKTPTPHPEGLATAAIVSWKAPIAFGFFALVAIVLFVGLAGDGVARFLLTQSDDAWQVDPILVPGRVTGIVVAVALVAITIASFFIARAARKNPLWLTIIFAALFLFGFLAWAAAASKTQTIPVDGLLAGAIALSVPLIFGSLAGVIGERVGVVNIAIEGQLLFGAFSAAIVSSVTKSPWAALIAAGVAGMLVAFILGAFSIKYLVDQIIVGVVVNVLISGLTGFLFSEVLSPNAGALNQTVRFDRWSIPGLADIPVIGPMFFQQTPIVYLAFIAVFVVWWAMFRTRWGLRLRAVGEHPTAADTVGIRVNRWRFWNVAMAGAIAGFGGAYYTLDSVNAFNKDMTAGAGYIALAAVIFGQWNPIKAALAALLFGFTTNLQSTLSIIGSPVPSEFMRMLPYIVTILAVAGFVGNSRGPAAAGQPYIKS